MKEDARLSSDVDRSLATAQSMGSSVSQYEYIHFTDNAIYAFQTMQLLDILVDDEAIPYLILATDVPSILLVYAEQLAFTNSNVSNQDGVHCDRGEMLRTCQPFTDWHESFASDCTRLFVGQDCIRPNVMYTAAYTYLYLII